MSRAKCARGENHPDDWFPPTETARDARLLCRGCPVISRCHDYATDAGYLGIWGGTTTEQRKITRQARQGDRGQLLAALLAERYGAAWWETVPADADPTHVIARRRRDLRAS